MRVESHILASLSVVAICSTSALAQNPPAAQQPAAPMTFFITSVGKGDGANLGGLAGADTQCATRA